jgi:hypothetical protein
MFIAPHAALLVAVAGAALALTSPASVAKPDGLQKTCRGPASLSNSFTLGVSRKLTVRHVGCAAGSDVAKAFARSCERAYAGQGACTIRSHSRWRCQSRLVGGLDEGAPARVSCNRTKAKVVFVITKVAPSEAGAFPQRRLAGTSPYNEAARCATTASGYVLDPPPGESFEIRALAGVARTVSADIQSMLVGHRVSSIYHTGLAANPHNTPKRTPILLTNAPFDAAENFGVFTEQCEDRAQRIIVARTNTPKLERQRTAAHELFHAYADGLKPGPDTWWEEASATWAEWKVGLGEDEDYDVALQYPGTPLNWFERGWPYAMSRFVQFLDDGGFLGGGEWPLQRDVLAARGNPTSELAAALVARRTTLGEQSAAFWGDRLKKKPSHGPQLVPGPANSNEIKIEAGRTQIPIRADALRTKLFDFKLAADVVRVELVFSTDEGYFWGLTSPANGSRRIEDGEDISFCAAKADPPDLEWPGHFPVTFTNGKLSGVVTGEILIYAQTDAANCKKQAPPSNRACTLLRRARVGDVLGGGLFSFASQSEDETAQQWLCFYDGEGGEARLNLAHYKKATPKMVRANAKRLISQLDLNPVDIGDLAGIGVISGGDQITGVLVMAVGREIVFLMVGPGAKRPQVITLGRRISGELK